MTRPLLTALLLAAAAGLEAQPLTTLLVPSRPALSQTERLERARAVFFEGAGADDLQGFLDDADRSAALDAALEAVLEVEATATGIEAEVYADGAIQSGITDPQAAGGTATGSVGVKVGGPVLGRRGAATFRISVVGAADSVASAFGASLLAPASGTTLHAGLVDARLYDARPLRLARVDVRAYGSVSTAEWSVPDSLADSGRRSVDVGTVGLGLLVGKRIVSGELPGGTSVGIGLDVGLSGRWLVGDVAATGDEALLEAALDEPTRAFGGLEVTLGIQVGGTKAGLSYYHYSGDVPGLSRGQVVGGIGLEVPLLRGAVTGG